MPRQTGIHSQQRHRLVPTPILRRCTAEYEKRCTSLHLCRTTLPYRWKRATTFCNAVILALFTVFSTALSDAAEEPLFFIDSPQLIRTAAEAVYLKYPDISEGGLVARDYTIVSSHCYPGQGRVIYEPSETQCPADRFTPSPCVTELEFVIRDTIKRDVTALSNDRCKFHTQYQSVSVKIYEDNALVLRRSGLNQESESTGTCEDTGSERFFELEEILARHKKILKLEASSFPVAMQPPEHKELSR